MKGKAVDPSGDKKKVPADELRHVPFPECSSKCALVEYLGVCECESACGHKFDKDGNVIPFSRNKPNE